MAAFGGLGAGELVIYAAAVTSGLGVLWRFFVRRGWRAWRKAKAFAEKANEIVTRELTHNGGESLKDVVHSMNRKMNDLATLVESVVTAGDENSRAVAAIAVVMDALVERKQEDHERIWQQIVALGGADPRAAHPPHDPGEPR